MHQPLDPIVTLTLERILSRGVSPPLEERFRPNISTRIEWYNNTHFHRGVESFTAFNWRRETDLLETA